MPRVTAPFSALVDQEVFAVDAHSTQLVVRATTNEVVVDIDQRQFTGQTTSGVAVIEVDGLEPDTSYRAVLSDADGRSLGELHPRTRSSPGTVLSRFATVSDVHLGASSFGPAKNIKDHGDGYYSLRSGRAAVEHAVEWGAEIMLVKGDLTDTGIVEEWELAQEMFRDIPIPFRITAGNHDQWKTREINPDEGAVMLNVSSDPVQTIDLDGVRLVLADTSMPDKGSGTVKPIAADLIDAVSASTPSFVGLHHNIQRLPMPWFWPPGIPSNEATPVLADMSATNPRLFISSGHTCLLYTSPSPRDRQKSRMPSSA